MKEGWKMVKLGAVCKIGMGKTPPRGENKYWDVEKTTGNIWVSIADMSKSTGGYIYDSKEYISIDGASLMSIIPKGTILLSFKLSLGKALIAGENLYTNEAIANLPLISKEIGKNYLLYYFQYFDWEKYASGNEKVKGKTLNKKTLEILPVICPPLEEQHRIVSILDATFEKIDKLKANAEENLKNAKALFQQVLAQELKPKEGWVEKKLGELCNNISYGTSLPSSENGIYKYLRMNNITLDGTLDLNNLKYITVPDKELAKCMVEKGDLLFNRTNSHELVGKSCVFENDEKMVIAGYIIRIRLNKEIAPKFANYYINLQRRLGYLKPLIVGAVHQANISAKSIQTINFVYPTLEEQHRIVRTLDTLSEKCRRLEQVAQQTIRECDALKQSILRQAFSGDL